MSDKTLEELQVEHAELCARVADAGITLSDDLTVDFDTPDVGRTVVAGIRKLLTAKNAANNSSEVAEDQEVAHSDAAPKSKKTSTKSTKKAAPKKVAASTEPAGQKETTMATKTKKAKKTAPKKTSKAKTASKAAPKKGAAKKPRAEGKTAKIIAKMKNGGITRAEILKMTGWPSVSVQALAKSAGVKLVVSKERPFTYRAGK